MPRRHRRLVSESYIYIPTNHGSLMLSTPPLLKFSSQRVLSAQFSANSESLQNFHFEAKITEDMGWIEEAMASVKSLQLRQALHQTVNLGIIVASALMIWKMLMCVTGSESPVVVVLSESMEPGFARGDILFLHMSQDPIRVGEIVVYNVNDREIPIVHRVIKVHERQDTGEVDILTKGDNNPDDDLTLYAPGQRWLHRHHIMGRAVGFLPYVGWATIIMTEKPLIKYILIGALGLLVITSKD